MQENYKILVVDDDMRLRALLERYLTEQGFQFRISWSNTCTFLEYAVTKTIRTFGSTHNARKLQNSGRG